MQKLLFADHLITVLINFFEYLSDLFVAVLFVIEKSNYFIIGYHTWMIDIKVGKGLLKMLKRESFRLKSSHDKLCIIDLARTISINNSD